MILPSHKVSINTLGRTPTTRLRRSSCSSVCAYLDVMQNFVNLMCKSDGIEVEQYRCGVKTAKSAIGFACQRHFCQHCKKKLVSKVMGSISGT